MTQRDMGLSSMRLCIWSGAAAMVVFLIGVIPIGHLIPPPAAHLGVEDTAAFYRDNAGGIKAGALLVMFGGTMLVPLYVAIAYQLRRIEGRVSPMAVVQLCFGILNAGLFFTMALMWMAAAFRTGRDPSEIQLVSDIAWHIMVIPIPPLFLQSIVIAIVIFRDTSPEPIFPRWVAYFNVWAALMFIPGGTMPMYLKHGALSWQGVLGFYTEVVVYTAFVGVMSVTTWRAIGKEEAEAGDAAEEKSLVMT